jgi:nucleoside-diphosphate-sugar epimerase
VQLPAREDSPLAGSEAAVKIRRIRETEDLVLKLHPSATHLRYPYIYGPNQILPTEWPVVRRALDKRPYLMLADGGLTVMTAAYAGNAAHSVLLAFDRPGASQGQIYNVGDDKQFDRFMEAQIVADELRHSWEILSVPHEVARPAYPALQHHSPSHRLVDTSKIRDQLGYRDAFDPEQALRETIRWQRDHLYGKSESVEKILQDPFDYPAEDEMVERYREFLSACRAVHFESEPGFGFGYYGPRTNPAGARGSYRQS